MSKFKNRRCCSDEKISQRDNSSNEDRAILVGDVRLFSESRTPDVRLNPTDTRVIDRLAARVFNQNKETWNIYNISPESQGYACKCSMQMLVSPLRC
jgi:ribosome-associated toxin RatA of RatAB toxin-antitoxin module